MATLKEQIIKKYYSIGELSEEIKRAPSWIRFWSNELFEDKVKRGSIRNKVGNRMFTEEQKKKIALVSELSKLNWFTVEGIKQLFNDPFILTCLTESIRVKL